MGNKTTVPKVVGTTVTKPTVTKPTVTTSTQKYWTASRIVLLIFFILVSLAVVGGVGYGIYDAVTITGTPIGGGDGFKVPDAILQRREVFKIAFYTTLIPLAIIILTLLLPLVFPLFVADVKKVGSSVKSGFRVMFKPKIGSLTTKLGIFKKVSIGIFMIWTLLIVTFGLPLFNSPVLVAMSTPTGYDEDECIKQYKAHGRYLMTMAYSVILCLLLLGLFIYIRYVLKLKFMKNPKIAGVIYGLIPIICIGIAVGVGINGLLIGENGKTMPTCDLRVAPIENEDQFLNVD